MKVAMSVAKRPASSAPVLSKIGRLRRFFRQVVAELRKVIWPTRPELVSYTIVVLVFVVFMATLLALYDFGFAKAVAWLFGT